MAQPYYDSDEEDPPVGFEQDPDSDEIGDGWFTYSDGRREYSYSPQEAQRLDKEGKAKLTPEPAKQTMGMDAADAGKSAIEPIGARPSAELDEKEPAGAVQIPATSRIASEHNNPGNLKYAGQEGAERGEAAKDGGYFARFKDPQAGYDAIGKQVELDKKRGMTLGQFITKYAPPGSNDTEQYISQAAGALGAQGDTPLSDLDTGKLQTFIARKESSTNTGYQSWEDKRVRQERQDMARNRLLPSEASTQQADSQQSSAGMQSSASASRTGSAMPLEEFQASQERLGGAYDQAIQTTDDNRFSEAAQLAERAAQMMQAGRDREAAATAAIAQREQRAMQTQAKMKEVGARPIDNDKIWKDKGVFGTLMGFLGVAAGSAYATKHGGPNTALQTINEQRQQAIKSQMEDRDSELRTLEKELGSLDAAVPVLEARMNKALEDQVQANLVNEKSQMALRNGRDLIAKLQIEREKLMGDAAKAYYGTLAQQQATTQNQSFTQGTEQRVGEQSVDPMARQKPLSADDELKQRLARRDMASLEGSGLTHDEFTKESDEYREKAVKQNDLRNSLQAVVDELGLSVTREGGKVAVTGAPDVDLLPTEKKRRIDDAFARLKRADVMSMLREPSADLQDEFGNLVNRPFWDSEIPSKLQRLLEMSDRMQNELDGGYNPAVVERYKSQGNVREIPGAKRVTGRIGG